MKNKKFFHKKNLIIKKFSNKNFKLLIKKFRFYILIYILFRNNINF